MSFSIQKEHSIRPGEVDRIVVAAAERMAEKYDLEVTSTSGRSLSATRKGGSGMMHWNDEALTVEVTLPFPLRVFKGVVRRTIEEELQKLIPG